MALTQTDFLRFCASAVDPDGVAQRGSEPIRSTITPVANANPIANDR